MQHRLQRQVAAAHHVTAARVCILCNKAKKNSAFFKEMINLREEKVQKREVIQQKVLDMNQLNVFVDSADHVKRALQ